MASKMTSGDSSSPPGGGGRSQGPGAPSAPTSVSADLLHVLASAALFKGFTETGLQIIGSIAQHKHVPAGTPLFVENMIGDGLFIIADGLVRVSVRVPDGREAVLAMLGPSESLGEAALLRGGPRVCTAIAEVPSTVIEITRRDIAVLQRSKPQACLKLMMGVVDVIGAKMRDAQGEYRAYLSWRLGVG
jgi:CRP/FNR family transcriptional regulator, cyclic AMP receptor protein